ncbi:hypothetical protein FA15DRAFT_760852 [Coprinopsis marcescibilis]|uniref:Uncharacterized protein n=1 Tax=Coprinopsis marcescibilis TaxID=230819 RepID=A0A5C3KDN1_COPMA|nr:hypothetical protein FA15DRAFT_760852 [Coprinopsis marcescibilis]
MQVTTHIHPRRFILRTTNRPTPPSTRPPPNPSTPRHPPPPTSPVQPATRGSGSTTAASCCRSRPSSPRAPDHPCQPQRGLCRTVRCAAAAGCERGRGRYGAGRMPHHRSFRREGFRGYAQCGVQPFVRVPTRCWTLPRASSTSPPNTSSATCASAASHCSNSNSQPPLRNTTPKPLAGSNPCSAGVRPPWAPLCSLQRLRLPLRRILPREPILPIGPSSSDDSSNLFSLRPLSQRALRLSEHFLSRFQGPIDPRRSFPVGLSGPLET